MNPLRRRALLPLRPSAFAPRAPRTAAPRRAISAQPPPPPPPRPSGGGASEAARKQSRLDRVISRLPGFLQRYLAPLRRAPLTHVTAFLLLHEITAVVPLVGLAASFHYGDWLPPFFAEGAWVKDGVERFGRYFRRKGWISEEGVAAAEGEVVMMEEEEEHGGSGGARGKGRKRVDRAWRLGEGGVRVLVEVATAWAVTKALLPARLALSVWATPWFARAVLGPVGRGVGRMFGRGRKS